MKSAIAEPTVHDDVRTMLDRYLQAVRQLDLEGITAHYASEIVAYDAIAQLEFRGIQAYAAHWKMCLEHCQAMLFEPREPTIMASGDLAVGFYLVKCGGVGPDGKEHVGWMRGTFAARRRDGRWLLVHEHYSSPFDPMTNQVLEGLEPQA